MDKEIIRAYLWQEIIRLGFCPSSTKDKKIWLNIYSKSLKNFWELDNYPSSPKEHDGMLITMIDNLPNGAVECCIESQEKFSVRYFYANEKIESRICVWTHDMDGNYFVFPRQTFLTCCNRSKTARKSFSPDDMEAVVDGLLLHQAVHIHLESPINYHNIRIGGGIENPFQYLFHLRYQFCLFDEKREAEKVRLIKLFSDAIKSQSRIAANHLMG